MTTPPWCREKVMVYYYKITEMRNMHSDLLIYIPRLRDSQMLPCFNAAA